MGQRGIALFTALVFMVILSIIGVGFLEFITRDYHFAGEESASVAAWHLAISGVTYYSQEGQPPPAISPPDPLAGKTALEIPLHDTHHYCEIKADGSGNILCIGTVTNAFGRVAGQRVIVLPGGSASSWYERSPTGTP